MNIADYIPQGENNAVSINALSSVLGIDERTVRYCILKARQSGAPICSTEYGYYIPTTIDEALAYYKTQRRRIITGFSALKPIAKYIRDAGTAAQWAELETLIEELQEAERGKADE